jgi:hypothetical protein
VPPRIVAQAALSCALICTAGAARADVSSWAFLGGGAAGLERAGTTDWPAGLMQLEIGMGTPASHPFVVGGLLKTMTFFGHGTDLAIAAWLAPRGFVVGDWGLALDAGGFERWWGPVHSEGGIGALVLGAPLGLQATAFGELGSSDEHTYGFTIGVDLMRMTVHRTTGLEHWQNPYQTK